MAFGNKDAINSTPFQSPLKDREDQVIPDPGETYFFLFEDGATRFLQEDGVSRFLLETAP